ncbi:MAG: hypothetical protein PF795_04555 [Kiritimatiellae bacterium]|nr:hypothetical protein [Kiritimatiellia bacterium]
MSTLFHSGHLFCAAYMTGVIWFVQLVHYPMLHVSNGAKSESGHRQYTRRMGFVVMPIMLTELVLQGVWLAREAEVEASLGAALLFLIWASTFFVQVPCHHKLQTRFEPSLQRKLVMTNWIRTLAWTARALLLTVVIAR